MSLKPAGLKTIREAIERLMNGEIFYSPEGWEIVYDEVNVECSGDRYSPFKVRGNGRSEAVNYLWEKVSDWQTDEYTWEDGIGDGVLCWASDGNRIPCKHDYLRFITAYDKNRDYPYRSKEVGYRFATPLTLEEVKQYIKG